jgi:hypothetical protein
LARKGIRRRIEDTCTRLRCSTDQLFKLAFQKMFGKRRGVIREARTAHMRFRDGQSLKARARRAITAFLNAFSSDLVPSTA